MDFRHGSSPLIVSFVISPLHGTERPLFESIMPVAIAASAVFFSVRYLRYKMADFLREGARIGLAWMAIALILDLVVFLQGPMEIGLSDYVKDIGLTYLIIPVITVGFGYLLSSRSGRDSSIKAV